MRRTILGFATLALLAATAADAHAGTLYLSQDSNANGLYTIDTITGLATLSGAGITSVDNQTVGLSPSETTGVLYGSLWQGLTRINEDGSGTAPLGPTTGIEGLAYDPAGDTLYGAINGSFFSVNQATGLVQASLAAPGGDVEGLAYFSGGIFGLADGGLLRRYDIGLGTWALVGDTGVDFDQIGLAYDTERNVLYAVGSQSSSLYEIDPLNARTRIIGSTRLQDPGGGLAFVGVVPEPGTWALFGLGALALVGARRRRRKTGVVTA